MRGCWFSFDNRTMSESASYTRSKEGDNEMNEEERRKKMIRVAQGVKRYEGIRGGKCNPKRSACGRFGLNELPQ